MNEEAVNKKERPEFFESMIDTVKQNGGLLTGIAVAFIVVTGMALINNPGLWWIPALAVIAFGLIIFLFMNARVIIKVAFVSFFILLISSEAFKFGSSLDPYGSSGIVWMSSILFTSFALIAYSYIASSGKSRWGSLGFSIAIGYATTFILAVSETLNINISIIVGSVLSVALFVLTYKFSRKTRVSKKKVPLNFLSDADEAALVKGAEEAGMQATVIRDKKDKSLGGVLVWKEKAYLLYPIKMQQPFLEIGKKYVRLSYLNKSINPWLLKLAYNEVPTWRARGANINVVLLDINNKNGYDPKVIGVSIPDSKRKVPVGIFPAKQLLGDDPKRTQSLIDKIDSTMAPYSADLSEKQSIAISRINKTETK